MAQSTGRIWQRSKLSFQLIPEDQINSNLCLNTANTSHGQQPPAPAPGSRKALCVISLKGRWGWGVYSAIPHYKFYCDCATAGNTTEPVEYFKTHYKWQNKHNFFFLLDQNEVRWVFQLLTQTETTKICTKTVGSILKALQHFKFWRTPENPHRSHLLVYGFACENLTFEPREIARHVLHPRLIVQNYYLFHSVSVHLVVMTAKPIRRLIVPIKWHFYG